MIEDTFDGERKIKKIGGKLYEDYLAFKSDVFYINVYYFEFFSLLGMTDDISIIIEALQSHKDKKVFVEKAKRDISEGRVPRDKFISESTKKYAKKHALSEPEKVKKREEISISRNIYQAYKNIGESYLKEKKIYPFYPKHNHKVMEICGRSLYVTPSQLAIDCDKFIEIYGDYLAASASESGRLHEKVADTINQFFNGVEITHKELERYFMLEDGVIRTNPMSKNKESYSRLGWRNCK